MIQKGTRRQCHLFRWFAANGGEGGPLLNWFFLIQDINSLVCRIHWQSLNLVISIPCLFLVNTVNLYTSGCL